MTHPMKCTLLLLPWSLCALGAVYAQELPAPPAEAARVGTDPTPVYDAAQLPSFSGRVQQFTLAPRGEIDGVILSDGTEVKSPPGLSASMAYSIKPGDTITIHGLHAAAIPLVQAVSIEDRTTGKTLVDADPRPGPGGPPPPKDAAEPQQGEAQGTVRMALHGHRGEINGVLLSDGMVLRLPPDAALSLASLLQPGRTVVAEGNQVSNANGKVLDVSGIGPSRDALSPVGAAAPRPPGPRGARRRFEEAPPPPPASP